MFLLFKKTILCIISLNSEFSLMWGLEFYTRPFTLFQTDKKSQDLKEKPAIEENAFEALERDFQEVCIYERRTRP